jgi:hypothetical protein
MFQKTFIEKMKHYLQHALFPWDLWLVKTVKQMGIKAPELILCAYISEFLYFTIQKQENITKVT